jgi:3-phosphoshikimate 1-carboxyvinyltransferase
MSASEIAKLTGFLRSFGVEAEGVPEGFWVRGLGGAPLRASRVTTGGDPRLASLGVLLGLHTDGESVIDDVDALSEFMPKFVGTLRALGADIKVQT